MPSLALDTRCAKDMQVGDSVSTKMVLHPSGVHVWVGTGCCGVPACTAGLATRGVERPVCPAWPEI